MAWSQEQRSQFLGELESARRVLTAFYRCLMALVCVATLAASVWVFTWRPLGDGNQGEYFYFAVAAFFLLGWAINQLIWPTGRHRRRWMQNVAVESKPAQDGFAWEFRLGSSEGQSEPANSVRREYSHTFSIPLASLASELLPDEPALTCLEAELARGADLESACRLIQPAYEGWNALQRRAYQMYVKSLLAERRKAQ